jgi:NADPH:quinone reductase-like Zn-dependent oxidoreductase
MRAAVNTTYGPPEVVRVIDVDMPTVGDDEVLVKVHATTVNRTDCGFRVRQAVLRQGLQRARPAEGTEGSHYALVERLGADRVVDYTAVDFTEDDHIFDAVLDVVGTSSFGRCKRLLKARGIYLSLDLGPLSQNPLLALVTPLFRGRRVMFRTEDRQRRHQRRALIAVRRTIDADVAPDEQQDRGELHPSADLRG